MVWRQDRPQWPRQWVGTQWKPVERADTAGVPPELGRLPRLQLLWLNQNQLRGEIPPELGSLSNLAFLFLGGSNQLTGCVPSGSERFLNVPESDLNELGLPVC